MNIEELARKAGMTKDDVVRMAMEAGFPVLGPARTEAAMRFAAMVAAAEREECAKVCDELMAPTAYQLNERSVWDVATMSAGDAIRAKFKVTT